MQLEFIVRLVIAAVIGFGIGLEREYHAKEAGARTHLLVCLGSCLFMILSIYAFDGFYDKNHTSFDPSRIAAQVVTGIGFLGAGTIIFHKNIIRGLTTAAGLWVTSAIGLACGAGLYILAICSACIVVICLIISGFYVKKFANTYISISFMADNQKQIDTIFERLHKDDISVKDYSLRQDENDKYIVQLDIKTKKSNDKFSIDNILKEFYDVKVLSIE